MGTLEFSWSSLCSDTFYRSAFPGKNPPVGGPTWLPGTSSDSSHPQVRGGAVQRCIKRRFTCLDTDAAFASVWTAQLYFQVSHLKTCWSWSYTEIQGLSWIDSWTRESEADVEAEGFLFPVIAGRPGEAARNSGKSPGWSGCGGRRFSSSLSGAAAAVRNGKPGHLQFYFICFSSEKNML